MKLPISVQSIRIAAFMCLAISSSSFSYKIGDTDQENATAALISNITSTTIQNLSLDESNTEETIVVEDTTPTTIKNGTRRRATKVLDLLDFNPHQPLRDTLGNNEMEQDTSLHSKVSPVFTSSVDDSFKSSSTSLIFDSKAGGNSGKDSTTTSEHLNLDNETKKVVPDSSVTDSYQKRRLHMKQPIRRQEVDILSLLTQPAPPVQFTTVVSPLEASFGGLTGLQDLPALSFVQFIKLLVALTPFILPMIFIPLLIFTIGILMIPVTRSNVFVDVGDLRGSIDSSSGSPLSASSTSAILSNYLINPVKKFTGNVVMPRAYELANDVITHEECIERISCEIASRYVHYTHWDGTWRSAVNTHWISRALNYWWGRRPTVGRIAKSLENTNNAKDASVFRDGDEKRGHSHSGFFKPSAACRRYTCQPKSFIRKFLS